MRWQITPAMMEIKIGECFIFCVNRKCQEEVETAYMGLLDFVIDDIIEYR